MRTNYRGLVVAMLVVVEGPQKTGMRKPQILWIMLLTAVCARDQTAGNTSAAWKKLEFLLGNWTGVAGETPAGLGDGQGSYSFEADLNRKIMVRRSRSEYTSGVRHDDLMVIYFDAPKDTPRAIYFDSEGHVIRYNATFPAANVVIFESEKTLEGPRYRLKYWREGAALNGQFEIAEAGSKYKTYLTWTSRNH